MSVAAQSIRRSLITPYLNVILYVAYASIFLITTKLMLNIRNDKDGMTRLGFLMLVQLTPAIITFSRGGFNFITFVMLNHFVTYSVAKYNTIMNVEKTLLASTEAQVAISEMIYCSLLIIATYYFWRVLVFRTSSLRKQYKLLTLNQRTYTYIGGFVILQPYLYLWMPASLVTMHFLLSGLGMAMVFCSNTGNEATERWVKMAIVGATFYAFLTFGSLSNFAGMISFLFVITFIQWRIRNLILLILLAAVGTAIQSVKLEYRLITRANEQMSTSEQVSVLSDLLYDRYVGEWKEDNDEMVEDAAASTSEEKDQAQEVKDSLTRGFARVGDDSLERVLAMTPSRVPFWNGETYAHIPYIFIPRVLWPDKPRREIWHKFGKAYLFLSDDDTETSVGVNFLGEGYMNFGYAGLYAVACLFGTLVALMEWLSFRYLPSPTYFVFIVFLIPFMNYGHDLGSIINGMAIVCATMLILRPKLKQFILRDSYV